MKITSTQMWVLQKLLQYENNPNPTGILLNLSNHYSLVGYFFIVAFFISCLMFLAALLLSLTNFKDNEKLSEYECGFEPFDNATRHPFDVHFYVVGILFLIFDVEIAILFPWVLGLKTMG